MMYHMFTYTLLKYYIIWKNPELYKCIVILMGGFHKLCVKKRLIYKRSNCIGIKEWSINARIITPPDLAAQAMEGHHYCRYMHLHKECLDIELVQIQFEKMKG